MRVRYAPLTLVYLDGDQDEVTIIYPIIREHAVTTESIYWLLGSNENDRLRQRVSEAGDPQQGHVLAVPIATEHPDLGLAVTILRPEMGGSNAYSFTGNWSAQGCAVNGYWGKGSLVSSFRVNEGLYDVVMDAATARIEVDIPATDWG